MSTPVQWLNRQYEQQQTVGAVFRNTIYAVGHEQVYTYLLPDGMDVHVGDLGIVEKDGVYSIVTIRTIHDGSRVDPEATYRYKWIVGIVNPVDYLDTMKNEDVLMKEQTPTRV